MLSICFSDDRKHEWWVSSGVFERLFSAALEHGRLSSSFEEWRHIAIANGGLSFSAEEHVEGRALMTGLREAARTELERLGEVDLHSEDGTYKVSLEKLLAATDTA